MSDTSLAKLLTCLDGPEAALLTLAKLLTGADGPISDTEVRELERWLDEQAQSNRGSDQ